MNKVMSMVGKRYMEKGKPVLVLTQWSGPGPRNVLIERQDGTKVVRPFRGLRKLKMKTMKIEWDADESGAFVFGKALPEDGDEIWVEVYAYQDPADMRRWRYQVNFWRKSEYSAEGKPFCGLSGPGGRKKGKELAETAIFGLTLHRT